MTALLSAQTKTTILVADQNGAPVPNATVELEKTGLFVASEQGGLTLTIGQTGRLRCRVSSVGYTSTDTTITLPAPSVSITLRRNNLFLDPVEIRALRAGNKAPFAKTNLGRQEIEKLNLGQDLPFILNQTPSVTVTSDAGNGIGYTGIRIRGTDATRINVTVNGIPYNDAESQGTYFVDIPDIASSLNSIQIQRGVGTSSNGAGAFGASINLSTNDYNEKPYAESNNSFGSFNSWKNTVRLGTGLISNHFTVDARLSRVASDGFIDRAGTHLSSFYLSGAYYSDKSSLRFNIISGKEKTYQAWNGVPEYKLFYNKDSLTQHYYNNLGYLYNNTADSLNLFNSNPRKYNVFTYPNQTDNYQQDHYQLFFNHRLNDSWSLNTALYLSRGKGYYEEYKYGASYSSYGLPDTTIGGATITNTDLVRQLWLDNNLYGGIFSLMRKTARDQFTLGGGWSEYDGKHYGNITWAQTGVPNNYQWYNYKSWKKDANVYAKYQYKITPHLEALADVQYRRVSTHINGTRNFPDLKVDRDFNFFNPKLGLTYTFGALSAYASYAIANKEPNNDDYETGTAVNPPNREQLHDIELGMEKNAFNYSWGINFYYMNYKDQLVLTGKINDVGNPVRFNVPKSHRLGLELQGRYKLSPALQLSGNLTLSENRIDNFYDYIPQYDASFSLVKQDTSYYKKTDLAFSPNIIGSGLVSLFPFANAEVDLISKYTGKQYLDNSGSNTKKINDYFVQDLRLQYSIRTKWIKEILLVGQLNNIWDRKYESNGYTYSYYYDQTLVKENFYFPMAGRNFMVSLNVKM